MLVPKEPAPLNAASGRWPLRSAQRQCTPLAPSAAGGVHARTHPRRHPHAISHAELAAASPLLPPLPLPRPLPLPAPPFLAPPLLPLARGVASPLASGGVPLAVPLAAGLPLAALAPSSFRLGPPGARPDAVGAAGLPNPLVGGRVR